MKRKPVFQLSPEEVIRRCRERKHCDMCAGQVLALMSLMQEWGWTMTELAERSHVGRSMISEMLSLKKIATMDTLYPLVRCFGLKVHVFDLLAEFCLLAASLE